MVDGAAPGGGGDGKGGDGSRHDSRAHNCVAAGTKAVLVDKKNLEFDCRRRKLPFGYPSNIWRSLAWEERDPAVAREKSTATGGQIGQLAGRQEGGHRHANRFTIDLWRATASKIIAGQGSCRASGTRMLGARRRRTRSSQVRHGRSANMGVRSPSRLPQTRGRLLEARGEARSQARCQDSQPLKKPPNTHIHIANSEGRSNSVARLPPELCPRKHRNHMPHREDGL